MTKRLLLDLGKYLLAAALLTWVVYSNWAPSPAKAVAALGASTVGLSASPVGNGPLLAAALAFPDRAQPRGLGYVWQQHVVEGRPIHTGYLAAGFAVYALAVLLTLLRWHLLVRALDLPLRLVDALRYGLIGIFFNTFLPGAVGGDIIKAAALARTQTRRTAAVATVLMDRVLGLLALVWFVAVVGGIFWLQGSLGSTITLIVFAAIAVVAGTTTLWLALGFFPERLAEGCAERLTRLPLAGGPASELFRAVWLYRSRPRSIAAVMLLSGIGHTGFIVAFFCCAQALWSPGLGRIPSLADHFVLVPLGNVMQALIPTPGGAGGGEWGFAALYVLFHASEACGVLGSLVQRLFSWVLGIIGYAIYVWTKPAASTETPVEAPETAEERTLIGTGVA